MYSLSELLINYKVPGVRSSEIRRICAEEVTLLTGYPLTSKQLQYKNEQLFLTIPSVVKSALVLKQQEFADRLTARGVTLTAVR